MRVSQRSGGLSVRAPGKINISFRVGALQPDGSHCISTIYQAVNLYDSVTVYPSALFSAEMTRPSLVPGGERNLAVRAARLLAETTGVHTGAHLVIDKQVPRGSGMSGGSADAAAALVACNELWQTGLSRSELETLSLQLGADVPFALQGGTALGTGHGDEFTQVLSVGTYHWVVVPARERLSEDVVVRQLDEHRAEHAAELGAPVVTPRVEGEMLSALRLGCPHAIAELMHNDLQMASLRLAPHTRAALELGEREGALAGVTLATSAGLAFLVEHREAAKALRNRFARENVAALTVQGPVPGAQVTHSDAGEQTVLR